MNDSDDKETALNTNDINKTNQQEEKEKLPVYAEVKPKLSKNAIEWGKSQVKDSTVEEEKSGSYDKGPAEKDQTVLHKSSDNKIENQISKVMVKGEDVQSNNVESKYVKEEGTYEKEEITVKKDEIKEEKNEVKNEKEKVMKGIEKVKAKNTEVQSEKEVNKKDKLEAPTENPVISGPLLVSLALGSEWKRRYLSLVAENLYIWTSQK